MKRIVVILIKTVLAGLFLANIGFFRFISQDIESDPMPPEKADHGLADREYLNAKIRNAEQLSENYNSERYFADLTDIKIRERNNDFDRNTTMSVNYTTQRLCCSHNEVLRKKFAHASSAQKDSLNATLTIARDKHLAMVDPEGFARDQEFAKQDKGWSFWLSTLSNLLAWASRVYCKNFFLALTLLLTWLYQKEETLRFKNPLSFLICLLAYPILIPRVWLRKLDVHTREFALAVEFKRRDRDLFSLISENEWEDIKRFAKSNLKISDYRKYLDNQGMERRHALATAMIAIIILMITCVSLPIQATQCQSSSPGVCLIVKPPPDTGGHQVNRYDDIAVSIAAIVFSEVIKYIVFQSEKVFLPQASPEREGFKQDSGPIPVFC